MFCCCCGWEWMEARCSLKPFQAEWLETISSVFSCHWSLVHPSGLVLDSLHMPGCMLLHKQKALGCTPSSLTDVLYGLKHVPLPPGRSQSALSYGPANSGGSVTLFQLTSCQAVCLEVFQISGYHALLKQAKVTAGWLPVLAESHFWSGSASKGQRGTIFGTVVKLNPWEGRNSHELFSRSCSKELGMGCSLSEVVCQMHVVSYVEIQVAATL